jgi:hypothetical protein
LGRYFLGSSCTISKDFRVLRRQYKKAMSDKAILKKIHDRRDPQKKACLGKGQRQENVA